MYLFKVLELLLHNDASSAGVNVNIRDAKGNTPLHVALSRYVTKFECPAKFKSVCISFRSLSSQVVKFESPTKIECWDRGCAKFEM